MLNGEHFGTNGRGNDESLDELVLSENCRGRPAPLSLRQCSRHPLPFPARGLLYPATGAAIDRIFISPAAATRGRLADAEVLYRSYQSVVANDV